VLIGLFFHVRFDPSVLPRFWEIEYEKKTGMAVFPRRRSLEGDPSRLRGRTADPGKRKSLTKSGRRESDRFHAAVDANRTSPDCGRGTRQRFDAEELVVRFDYGQMCMGAPRSGGVWKTSRDGMV